MRTLTMLMGIASGLLAPVPAIADIKLTYRIDTPAPPPQLRIPPTTIRINVYVDDAGRYRRERLLNDRIFLEALLRDGTFYVTRGLVFQGRKDVMRQIDVTTATDEAYRAAWNGKPPPRAALTSTIEDLGPEKVAGYDGRHYRIRTWFDGQPRPDRDVVVSTDKRLAPVVRAEAAIRAASPGEDRCAGNEMLCALLASGVILREDRMRLDHVDGAPIDPALFALPGPVLVLDQVRTIITANSFRAPPPPPAPPKR